MLVSSSQDGKRTPNEAFYKYDWSRQGQGLSATSTRQRSSLARDVYDPNEVSTLPATKALVLIGDRQPIVDDKSLVWEHRNYDPTYMGAEPERTFDYLAWKRAGRPMGEALAGWEEAWFSSELPAREGLRRAERALALARHEAELSGADVEGDPDVHAAEAHVRECREVVDAAHRTACAAAGHPEAEIPPAQTARDEKSRGGTRRCTLPCSDSFRMPALVRPHWHFTGSSVNED